MQSPVLLLELALGVRNPPLQLVAHQLERCAEQLDPLQRPGFVMLLHWPCGRALATNDETTNKVQAHASTPVRSHLPG
jgi:hypothetical protein